MHRTTTPAETIGLDLDRSRLDGRAVLQSIMELSERAVDRLNQTALVGASLQPGSFPQGDAHLGPMASVARLRGTGPGVSFRRLVEVLEADHPVELKYPFEANERVGGAIWPGTLVDEHAPHSLMKLRWEARADDLPMHSHEHSDRCIIVLNGRGFFHVSREPVEGFTGTGVRTIAARERDVFVFRRGTVHTFSTCEEPMELLSCHLPFIPLDDPRQYTLPQTRWVAGEQLQLGHSIELHGLSPIVACR